MASLKRKIYVASSWRNKYFDDMVEFLQGLGHETYNFKNPEKTSSGFHWADLDPNFPRQTHGSGPILCEPAKFKWLLEQPTAIKGHTLDKNGMIWADTCVAVMPFGRSASLEVGWFIGQNKPVFLYIPEPLEPELMFRDCTIVLEKESLSNLLTSRTCPYKGCSDPFNKKPPCELCYE